MRRLLFLLWTIVILANARLDVRVHRSSSTFSSSFVDTVLVTLEASVRDNLVHIHQAEEDGSTFDVYVNPTIEKVAFPQIIRFTRPGEPLLGQPDILSVCFLVPFDGSVIDAEAVSRLRQRNPQSVRFADEQREDVTHLFMYNVHNSNMSVENNTLDFLCRNASIYVSNEALEGHRRWFGEHRPLLPIVSEMSNEKVFEDKELMPVSMEMLNESSEKCSILKVDVSPCLCELIIDLMWFPCAIKLCDEQEINEETKTPRRCGIRSCRQRHHLRFPARKATLCIASNAVFDVDLDSHEDL